MNERYIVVGNNKDGEGYYAMFCNEHMVLPGATMKEAICKLIDENERIDKTIVERQPEH